MELPELCFHLRRRRRMYLLDDRFVTAVAFVEGFDAARDGIPLRGFQNFVADRIRGHESPIHWAYLIASTSDHRFLVDLSIGQVPPGTETGLTDMLVDLLESYHESTKVPPPPPG
jgi:hypothetical protein